MSLLRTARPLAAQLVRTAGVVARPLRPFTSARPTLTSGYGKSTGSGTQAGGQGAIDPQAGGEVPMYSGPSIAEKRKGGPVDQEAGGEVMKAKREQPDAESHISFKKNNKGTAEKTKSSQTTRGTRNTTEGHKDLNSKRTFSTLSKQKLKDDLKVDAQRVKQELSEDATSATESLKNTADKAAYAGKVVVNDVKESGQKLAKNVKQAVRAVVNDAKDAVSGKRSFSTHASGTKAQEGQFAGVGAALDAQEGRKGMKKGGKNAAEDLNGNLKGKSSRLSAEVAETLTPMSSDSEKLRTSARRGTVRLSQDDDATSAPSMGEHMESVKKSFLDGPQDMPQGVGQRALDDEGRPMETGTRRS